MAWLFWIRRFSKMVIRSQSCCCRQSGMKVRKDFHVSVLIAAVVTVFWHSVPNGAVMTSGMDYFLQASDCLAIFKEKNKYGWASLIQGLQSFQPIPRRARCYMYCFFKKAGIIEDAIGHEWNDENFSHFVHVLIRHEVREAQIYRAYYKCKMLVPGLIAGVRANRKKQSRCDNVLVFLLCLRLMGVSFNLDNAGAISEHILYQKNIEKEADMVWNWILLLADAILEQERSRQDELRELMGHADRASELRFLNHDEERHSVTVFDKSRAEAFWNSFDGSRKHHIDNCPNEPNDADLI